MRIRTVPCGATLIVTFLCLMGSGRQALAEAQANGGKSQDDQPARSTVVAAAGAPTDDVLVVPTEPLETSVDPPNATAPLMPPVVEPAQTWTLGPYSSIQVNVNAQQNNIIGDAANEPTIAIDPSNPMRMVIAWRQFDTVTSNFRQAGVAYSHDGGQTWTKNTLTPGFFRSDPVLGSDAAGNFYYSSLSSSTSAELFKSVDGGMTWMGPISSFGGDKQWLAVDDRLSGMGAGYIYLNWNVQFTCCPPNDFTRSANGGASFPTAFVIPTPSMKWGTLDVGPNGVLYFGASNLSQTGHLTARCSNCNNAAVAPVFDFVQGVNLGGTTSFGGGPNPGGLLGQVWIATDHSTGPTQGNLYMLASVNPPGTDPLDVMFIRSTNGGVNWTAPIRVNDDPPAAGSYQWFGTMSVAPNGRIDAVWNHTSADPTTTLRYSSSVDAGSTWAPSIAVSPSYNRSLGYPQQNKLGDYYHIVSDNLGVSVAYAATFNGEQDVYYLRINIDCNGNGIPDGTDIANGTSMDCNANTIPDECDIADCTGEPACDDCNDNDVPDGCDITAGTTPDCNLNSVPDVCDVTSGRSMDCNADTIPDECELAGCPPDQPRCQDCDRNNTLDECDIAACTGQPACADCNSNAIPDECDIRAGISRDTNANGIPDECETGACCDAGTGLCADDVPMALCTGDQRRWFVNTQCADLDPPCSGACCDRLTGVCTENAPPSACLGAQQRWTGGATCSAAGCVAVTGACCDHDPLGGCTDGLTRAECNCGQCEWTKLALCGDVTCPQDSIPTVGGWGLTILSLLLLTAAKIRFGRRLHGTALP